MRTARAVTFAVGCALAFPSVLAAQDAYLSLEGLQDRGVMVTAGTNLSGVSAGLRPRLFEDYMTKRLEQARIPIRTTSPGAVLHFHVLVEPLGDGKYAYATLLRVRQPAELASGRTVLAATWESMEIETSDEAPLLALDARLAFAMDEFLNDFAAVNPL